MPLPRVRGTPLYDLGGLLGAAEDARVRAMRAWLARAAGRGTVRLMSRYGGYVALGGGGVWPGVTRVLAQAFPSMPAPRWAASSLAAATRAAVLRPAGRRRGARARVEGPRVRGARRGASRGIEVERQVRVWAEADARTGRAERHPTLESVTDAPEPMALRVEAALGARGFVVVAAQETGVVREAGLATAADFLVMDTTVDAPPPAGLWVLELKVGMRGTLTIPDGVLGGTLAGQHIPATLRARHQLQLLLTRAAVADTLGVPAERLGAMVLVVNEDAIEWYPLACWVERSMRDVWRGCADVAAEFRRVLNPGLLHAPRKREAAAAAVTPRVKRARKEKKP